MAKLKTQLAKDSSHNLSWSALNVYRNQLPKHLEVFDFQSETSELTPPNFSFFPTLALFA